MALDPITRREQIISGKDLKPITRMEKFLKQYGGGSGGGAQSDWNQTDSSAADFIKNKPFWDMPTGGDTLYWDGNTEGLVSLSDVLYKISDAIPTMADLANGCTITLSTGDTIEITADNIADMVFDFTVTGVPAILIYDFALIALEDNADLSEAFGFVVPQKGFYFVMEDGLFTSSLTINGYTGFPVAKKIEEKYLPGAVILYADAENYLYATADTSDTSKRMTRAELMAVLKSGRSVYYMYQNPSLGEQHFPAVITFAETFGACQYDMLGVSGVAFTAEYTAS